LRGKKCEAEGNLSEAKGIWAMILNVGTIVSVQAVEHYQSIIEKK
jgi:hypothetical protein